MCGIGVVLRRNERADDAGCNCLKNLRKLVENRGPDDFCSRQIAASPQADLTLLSSVLSLRGRAITRQPLEKDIAPQSQPGNHVVFQWNGEDYSQIIKASENDGVILLNQISQIKQSTAESLANIFKNVDGPYAFVAWFEDSKELWFGRDIYGRRSMLFSIKHGGSPTCALNNSLILSSVSIGMCENDQQEEGNGGVENEWIELPVGVMFCISFSSDRKEEINSVGNADLYPLPENFDLVEGISRTFKMNAFLRSTYGAFMKPFRFLPKGNAYWLSHFVFKAVPKIVTAKEDQEQRAEETEDGEVKYWIRPSGCRKAELIIPPCQQPILTTQDILPFAKDFVTFLQNSVQKRVVNTILPKCDDGDHARIAILFSGGIDSFILAVLVDICLSDDNRIEESIDLLNVSFAGETAPDRIAGRQGFEELSVRNPKRKWNFIAIDVSKEELMSNQHHIAQLLHPRTTVMDMTIGPALWYSSKGLGTSYMRNTTYSVGDKENGCRVTNNYESHAKILIVGHGADEQLAGYARHRSGWRFPCGGECCHVCTTGCCACRWQRLNDELEKDNCRLWLRNLGRDDRIMSDLGKEARHPFLDSEFSQFVANLPLWVITDPRLPLGVGDKRILRVAAENILNCSHRVATLAKKAIQFGSKIAHLTAKKKGGHIKFTGFQ